MSVALATKGQISYQPESYTFNRNSSSLVGITLAAKGYITEIGFVDLYPQYNFEEVCGYEDVVITAYPSGMEQRIVTVSATRRQFNLNFKLLTSSKLEDLWQFYQDHHGPAYSFLFKNPRSGETVPVRFASKSMSRTLFAYQLESTGLQLIEVIGE